MNSVNGGPECTISRRPMKAGGEDGGAALPCEFIVDRSIGVYQYVRARLLVCQV